MAPPIAPIGLTASLINTDPDQEYLGDIEVSFRAPPGEELYYPGEAINTVSGYVYTVNLGGCVAPDNASYGGSETPGGEVTTTLYPSPDQPGRIASRSKTKMPSVNSAPRRRPRLPCPHSHRQTTEAARDATPRDYVVRKVPTKGSIRSVAGCCRQRC